MSKQITPADRAAEPANLRGVEYVAPVVDLHREADAYRLDVEMPGVSRNSVEITVEDGKLIITGHRASQQTAGRVLHSERDTRDYRRVFDLDPTIDVNKIAATMDQGLLQIRLHKADVHQPRKIAVS